MGSSAGPLRRGRIHLANVEKYAFEAKTAGTILHFNTLLGELH